MLSSNQMDVIRRYVSGELFDIDRLTRYLETHDKVGGDVFNYCKKDDESVDIPWKLEWLDSDRAFLPIDTNRFIKRIPFYFHVPDLENRLMYGSLQEAISSIDDGYRDDYYPELLEKLYKELEYLFYEKEIPLEMLFSYIIDQYGYCDAPILSWADYIHICDDLQWSDYYPECFIWKYNKALEAVGRQPLVYEIYEHYNYQYVSRQGKVIELMGQFPVDEEGKPELRWTDIRIVDAEKICCSQKKSRKRASLKITLTPNTVIFCKGWAADEEGWGMLYVGPQRMTIDEGKIKAQRERLGFTQQQVAEAVGTTLRTYQKWEKGPAVPNGYYLVRLLNWLDIPDIQDILKYEGVTIPEE